MLIILLFSNVIDRSTVLWVTALGAGLVTVVQLLVGAGTSGASATATETPEVASATSL